MADRRTLVVLVAAAALLAATAALLAGSVAPGGQSREAPGPPGTTPAGTDRPDESASAPPPVGTASPDVDEVAPPDGAAPDDGAGSASGTTTDGPTAADDATPAVGDVPPPEVEVVLNCTFLRVTVTPEAWDYRLHLRYRNTVTGDHRHIAAGFFTGTVTDHFGSTDFALVAVEVRVTGFPPLVRTRPARCPG